MTFLPIVQRELRTGARRRSTSRVRWWTTVLGMMFGSISLAIVQLSSSRGRAGASLFDVLSWYTFALCLLAGVFLTADSLSAEKRQGTLGLLFLSELKGYDVVLGKFIAKSLDAFYCLLALLPVTGISVLLGGVTGAQFWRTALALVDVLFFSLAAGMFVSVFGGDSGRSMGNTLVLVVLLTMGLPILASMGARLGPSPVWSVLASASPLYVFAHSDELKYAGHAGRFWSATLEQGLLACAFLAAASGILPRSWRESPGTPRPVTWGFQDHPKFHGSAGERANPRGQLLARNPVDWLTSGQLGTQWAAWAVVLAWALVVVIGLAFPSWPFLSGYFVMPFGFLLKLLFAFQATRFLAEGRRNGALDLLLCTPLTSREIVHGHARALGRAFLWPLVAFLALVFAPPAIRLWHALVAGNVDQAVSAFSGSFFNLPFVVRLGTDLLALCWFGMALALTTRRPNLAPVLTVLFVLILPSLFSFCWLDIVADIFFISWGIAKLQQDLRRLLAQSYQCSFSSPSVVAAKPLVPVPPIIAS